MPRGTTRAKNVVTRKQVPLWWSSSDPMGTAATSIWTAWNQHLWTASTCDETWRVWTTGTSTSTIVTAQSLGATWLAWSQTHWQTLQTLRGAPAVISEETRRRMAEEERRWVEEQNRREQKRREARERAKALLVQHLTEEQRVSLETRGYFDIQVAGKTYRIRQGTHGNVRLVENGRETLSYCAQPIGVPDEDAMLAQKIMLECAEPEFLRVANVRRLVA